MGKDKLKQLAIVLGIGAAIGTLSWYLVSFTSSCIIASAITGGAIGTLMTMLIMSDITENTTDSEKDWFVFIGVGIMIFAFGTAVILNQIANAVFPNATLSGWPEEL